MEFRFKNPNRFLLTYGIIYLILEVIAYFAAPMVFLGFGLLVKILILLWIPRAAALVGRNASRWTIFCFLSPSVGLITLGSIGYNEVSGYIKITEECTKWLNEYNNDLEKQLSEGKIDNLEKENMLEEYLSDLQDFADKQLAKIYKTDDDSFLTEQLKRKGYVVDNDSDVFVEFNEACPACGMKLNEKDKVCPDCGLTLFPD